MAYEYRVTKYDPRNRDERGVYTVDEWIVFAQVGSIIGGQRLTIEEYQRTEDAYVAAAISFLRESTTQTVTVRGLEDPRGDAARRKVGEGSDLKHEQVAPLIRLILRDLAWCKLESQDTYVHFGRDYYMYVGVPIPCEQSRALARERRLFVEDCPSPCRDGSADQR